MDEKREKRLLTRLVVTGFSAAFAGLLYIGALTVLAQQ